MNSGATTPPTLTNQTSTSIVNRTLLHHQQGQLPNRNSGTKNGTTTIRGLANSFNDTPPPDYNLVHDISRHDLVLLFSALFFFPKLSSRDIFEIYYFINSLASYIITIDKI